MLVADEVKDKPFVMPEHEVDYFKADFFIPRARLFIEINGRQHFYPYTLRPNQFTQFKMDMILHGALHNQKGECEPYQLLHLNAPMLEGLSNNPEKVYDMLKKVVK